MKLKKLMWKLGILAAVVIAVAALRLFVLHPAPPAGQATNKIAEGLTNAVKSIVPGAATVTDNDARTLLIKDGNGKILGYAVDTTGMPGLDDGYAGKVPVVIAFSETGKITGIAPLNNQETPSYIERVKGRGLFDTFNGMKPAEALARTDVNAISGATYTSRAVLSASRAGFGSVSDTTFKPAATVSFWTPGNIAAALVILFGLICWVMPRKFRFLRPILLVADVIILGFMQGTMLSLALFAGWISGADPATRILTSPLITVILVLSVILPLFSGRHFWCSQLCPFGAASELSSKIKIKRLSLNFSTRKILRLIGLIYLSGILGLLVVWPTLDLASLEPFAAFSLTAAPVASVVLAITGLLTSIFCPRLWCRFLCPTGRILEIFTIRTPSENAIKSLENADAAKCS